MKKLICILSALILALSLSACLPDDDAISGVAYGPEEEYTDVKMARYENQTHGIILEYPETYKRVGNLDSDGFLTFEGDGNVIAIYLPDTEADLEMSESDYTTDVLGLPLSSDVSLVTYGKTTGYRTFTYNENLLTLEFIAKGVDGFYRFSFTCDRNEFTEDDPVFSDVMSSIRIDDGVFISLYKMSAQYTVLLQYATTQQYVTDADYANHCLNNYETSGDTDQLNTAKETFSSIKTELLAITNHRRKEDESFEELWVKIVSEAERLEGICDNALDALERGDIKTAQKLTRTEFSYSLSDNAALLISAIQTEVGEYY